MTKQSVLSCPDCGKDIVLYSPCHHICGEYDVFYAIDNNGLGYTIIYRIYYFGVDVLGTINSLLKLDENELKNYYYFYE